MNEEQIRALIRKTGGLQFYAIERIKRQDPLERDNKNKDQTLKIFLDAGFNLKEHNLWRDSYMPIKMQAIALQEWKKLNQYMIEKEEIAINLANDSAEVQDSSDSKLKGWRDISLSLRELEIIAAEEYILIKKRAEKDSDKTQNTEPVNTKILLTWEEMKDEILSNSPGVTNEAIRQATYRAIKKAHQEQRQPPIQIRGCLKEKGYVIQQLCDQESVENKKLVEDCKYSRTKE